MILKDEESARRAHRIALLDKMIAARMKGDLRDLEKFAAPDVVFRLIGNRAFSPFVGIYRGLDAARIAVNNLIIEFEYANFVVDHLMIDGDQVGMRWRGQLRNRGTGASGDFEGFIHMIFEGDLLKEYVVFIDTASMARLADWG